MKITQPNMPLQSHYIQVGKYKIHYLDEGQGEIVLIAHGIPEWSMLYAELVKKLSTKYRCIIPDHLGFGLSDKDMNADLSPQAHADRLVQFAEALNLSNINLHVHDLGGPIGIGALIKKPALFKSLHISNSFCWNLENTAAGKPLKMMQGGLGRWLYLDYGFSVKFMAKNGFADKKDFARTKDLFLYPHQTREQRYANYQLMLEMLRSGSYYDNTLQKLKSLNIPVHISWGMKDKFFDINFLNRWKAELPNARFTEIAGAGHFPQIEAPGAIFNAMQ